MSFAFTDITYADTTGRLVNEATEQRIALAVALFESRIGQEIPSDMNDRQVYAATQWIARAIALLVDNDDSPAAVESVRLGRFQVTPAEGSTPMQEVAYADALVVSARLVQRRLSTRRGPRSAEQDRYSI